MVIYPAGGRLRLTLQTDHARLAGELAAAWGGGLFARPEPLEPIRLATEMHDEGWSELDAAPMVNPATGRPYDFLQIPQQHHTAAHTRTVERALAAHPYAGLLTSLHATGLYRKRYGHLPHIPQRPVDPACQEAVDRFLADQDQLQRQLTEELQPDPVVLWTHYRWLELWDMASLWACMMNPADRGEYYLGAMPRFPGGPDERLTLRGAGEELFTLDPWPFSVERITLLWPARWLEDRPYASDGELRAALAAAPMEVQSVTLAPR
ncbi:MAG: DUF3891 family protein [Bacillota bacterium]